MSAIPDAELWAELETALAEAARIFPPPAPIQAHHVLQQIVRIGGLAALPRHSSLVAALQEAFELRDRHPDLFTSQSTLAFAGRLREAPPDTINAFLISLDDALTTEAALAAGGDGCTWQGEKEPCLQDIALCGGMSKECIKELKYSVCFCGISSSRIMLWALLAVLAIAALIIAWYLIAPLIAEWLAGASLADIIAKIWALIEAARAAGGAGAAGAAVMA